MSNRLSQQDLLEIECGEKEKNKIWLKCFGMIIGWGRETFGGSKFGEEIKDSVWSRKIEIPWEMLLLLYFQNKFDRLVLNSPEVSLYSCDSCSCLSPYIAINFWIQICEISISHKQKPFLLKSLPANVYNCIHTERDNSVLGGES